MKLSVEAPALSSEAAIAEKSWGAILAELTKARLSALALITSWAGFFLGAGGDIDMPRLCAHLCGTGLLAGGAGALNQFMESEYDGRMRRTRERPIPSGRIQPQTALVFGLACLAGGFALLLLGVNALTAALGALTVTIYLLVYTPLKRVTWLNTLIGAVPGALPPLMGWTAARGEINPGGWALFAILFFWQIPHFLAIAWIYREDYARAGYRMLPVVDPHGRLTGSQSVLHTLALLIASAAPFALGLCGPIYFGGAMILGLVFLWAAALFARAMTLQRARTVFFLSITYLPLVLGLAMLDRQLN